MYLPIYVYLYLSIHVSVYRNAVLWHLYRPVWREPVRVILRNSNLTVFSSPPPGCGAIVGLVLNVLDQYNVTPLADCHLTHHRLVEAIKCAYGQRAHLADPAFVNTSGVSTRARVCVG